MKQSGDILKKTAIILVIAAVLGFGGYVMKRPAESPSGPSFLNVPKEAKIERDVIVEDTAPEARRFEKDSFAMEALKRCEVQKIDIKACKEQISAAHDVTAVAPDAPAEDGFAGFLIFPLQNGGNIVMDYNPVNPAEQMLFFGSFTDLQKMVQEGGMGDKLEAQVKSISTEIK